MSPCDVYKYLNGLLMVKKWIIPQPNMVWLNFAFVCSSLMQQPPNLHLLLPPAESHGLDHICVALGSWQRYFSSKSIPNDCSSDACGCVSLFLLTEPWAGLSLASSCLCFLGAGYQNSYTTASCMHRCAHRHACMYTCVHTSVSTCEDTGQTGLGWWSPGE